MSNETLDLIKQYISKTLNTDLVLVANDELIDVNNYKVTVNGLQIIISITGPFISTVENEVDKIGYLKSLNISSFVENHPGENVSLSALLPDSPFS